MSRYRVTETRQAIVEVDGWMLDVAQRLGTDIEDDVLELAGELPPAEWDSLVTEVEPL